MNNNSFLYFLSVPSSKNNTFKISPREKQMKVKDDISSYEFELK